MSNPAFVTALQQAANGALSFQDLIAAAQAQSQAGHLEAARQLYQVWIALNPDHPLLFIAQFNCSTLLTQAGDEATAEAMLRAALAKNPDFAPASINLGSALERRGAVGEALTAWKTGIERLAAVTGDAIEYKITLLKQVSRVLTDAQQPEAAESVLADALHLNPDQRDVLEQFAAVRLAQCKWPIASAHPKITPKQFVGRFHPLSACAYADDPLLQLAIADRYVQTLHPIDTISRAADRRHAPIPEGRKLRVGYVSSDLRSHAVGFLTVNLFEAHDPEAIEVIIYYCGIPSDDAITRRVKAAVPHWTDIRALSDDEAAAAIARDEIDILIDVNGHTRDARLGLFARRPAPVIVNWLGYPGTMGSAFHHYIIGDEWTIPPGAETYYSEHVLRVPCYQSNDRKRVIAEKRPTRAEAGLPEDAFVFCCFNAAHKVTRYSFERWMEILRATPGSVLWMLDYNPETNQRLREAAAARGVEPSRLVFAQKLANAYHLARYPLADLVLDTAPYGAHTTASDALWMGVPVLTMSGRCFASRVCGSLVRSAGVPELVTETRDDFIARAVALATTERAELAALRARIAANRDSCALFDIDRLARALEAHYHAMAQTHRRGATPKPNLANLDSYLEIGAAYDHDSDEIGMRGDYVAFYRAALAQRHALKPMAPDGRLWTELDVEAAEAAPPAAPRAVRAA